MTTLTLLLFVDAFRPDYVRDAPFLRSLARDGAAGQLREPFGFLPHPAYFAGMSPEDYGYSNMWCCDPSRSPFSVARWLPSDGFRTRATSASLRGFVDAHARTQVSAFASSYVSSQTIPERLLPFFAPVETEAPWSARAGYRSVFHELDARGDAWFACAWPQSNNLPEHSDAALVEHALSALKPHHRFAHVHLQELDAAGHWHGPEGRELRHLVRRTDSLVESFIDELRDRYDTLKIIVFGDHGMVSVTRSVDVRPALASTGLVAGVDYVYFADSTMVRLWFLTERSRRPLIDALSRVSGLRFLTHEDKVRQRIAGCHSSNAHEIVLADPGVVIAPDFFSGSSSSVPLGMHGYDPDCADNQGIFIASAPEIPAGDAGIVDATEIYHWTRELLGLVEPRTDRVAPRRSQARFTQSSLPAADACIERQLETVLAQLEPLTAKSDAIVLTGSFGRGEGAAVVNNGIGVTALNDFDILIVGGPDVSSDLAAAAPELAHRTGLDFLDLAWADGTWPGMTATMLNLDLRYGSQVLRGRDDVFESMPTLAAGDITVHDALTLLLNRIGGLLSGLNVRVFGDAPLCPRDARYLSNQIVKALVAVGDAYLIEWRAYDPSYRVRRARFSTLAPGAGVDAGVQEVVNGAYRLKVVPEDGALPDPLIATIDAAVPVLVMLRRVASQAFGRHFKDVAHVSATVRQVTDTWVAADNERLLQRPAIGCVARDVAAGASIRQHILAEMPLLLGAIADPDFEPHAWEVDRAAIVSAWLAMNH